MRAGAAVLWPPCLVGAGVDELLVVNRSVDGVPAESPEDAMTRAKRIIGSATYG